MEAKQNNTAHKLPAFLNGALLTTVLVVIGLVSFTLALYATNRGRCEHLEEDNRLIWQMLYQIDKKCDVLILSREAVDPEAISRAREMLEKIKGLQIVPDSVLQ